MDEDLKMSVKNLPKTLSEDLFNFNGFYDRIFTYLIMHDYDWMYYKMQAEAPLTDGRLMKLEFDYSGFTNCEMIVQFDNDESVVYVFDSKIYDEYLKVYFQAQINAIGAEFTFYGGDIIIEFYNSVMQNFNEIRFEKREIQIGQ